MYEKEINDILDATNKSQQLIEFTQNHPEQVHTFFDILGSQINQIITNAHELKLCFNNMSQQALQNTVNKLGDNMAAIIRNDHLDYVGLMMEEILSRDELIYPKSFVDEINEILLDPRNNERIEENYGDATVDECLSKLNLSWQKASHMRLSLKNIRGDDPESSNTIKP